ncbi:restriction endonuclease [Vibrio sp. 1F263]|uniref:restriction endonuclease n=1 Tax=Vibrio sp. 1F263 TaxID=3230012 RepID=UPI00352FA054
MNYIKKYKEWCRESNDSPNGWHQKRGFAFEKILIEWLKTEGLEPRAGYKPDGEQIDGSLFLDGSVFLLEAKWVKDPIPASTIYQFKGKVDGKLSGTLGIFISMSGYSEDAIDALTLGKSLNVILFDKRDLDAVIAMPNGFKWTLKEKLRIAAEEGVIYHAPKIQQVTKEHDELVNFSDMHYMHRENRIAERELTIVCEGGVDRHILSYFVKKILKEHDLNKKVNFVMGGGTTTLQVVANMNRNTSKDTPVLVVIDSDGDYSGTVERLKYNITLDNWQYSVPHPSIGIWLDLEESEFRCMIRHHPKLLRALDNVDMEQLANTNKSFKSLYDWVKNA